MKRKIIVTIVAALLFAPVLAIAAYAGGATRVANAIWANEVIYDTVITPTSFKMPPSVSTDRLYNFGMSGLEGQRSVSESAPGQRGYNGGRWHVQMVVFTEEGMHVHDPDGDGMVNFELMSAAEVLKHQNLGHLIINDTMIYFECPMLPRK